MRYGISGKLLPSTVPFAREINSFAIAEGTVSPPLLAAIAKRESDFTPAVVSADGGHGLCQLTASWPDDWADPATNLAYAWHVFLRPAIDYWHGLERYTGDDLVRLVSATYNEGLGAAIAWHARGDVDGGTTNHYAEGVLENYKSFC